MIKRLVGLLWSFSFALCILLDCWNLAQYFEFLGILLTWRSASANWLKTLVSTATITTANSKNRFLLYLPRGVAAWRICEKNSKQIIFFIVGSTKNYFVIASKKYQKCVVYTCSTSRKKIRNRKKNITVLLWHCSLGLEFKFSAPYSLPIFWFVTNGPRIFESGFCLR